MNTEKIKDLEKKYMEEIWNVVSSNNFIDNLKNIEKYIINNYVYLDKHWDEKNKLKIGVERLIRFHFYKNLSVINIYPSPISSDMAIELEDVLLNIDAKTIDMIGNSGDDNSIHFQKNQITFDNKPFFNQSISNHFFSGVTFPPRLEPFYKGKPVLTFFVTVNYYDNGKNFFKLSHLSVCCVPHKDIVNTDFSNDIISNFKTYEYIDKEKAKTFSNPNLYEPKRNKDSSWIEFSLKGATNNDAFLDPNLSNPIDTNSKSVWKKIDNQYKIVLYGGSARISKSNLKNRKDSSSNLWEGVRYLEIYSKREIEEQLKNMI